MKPRLVDLNQIEYFILVDKDGVPRYKIEIGDDIGVEEVDAIPVEWIKHWADERCCGDLTVYGQLFYDMLEDWEKEIEI